MTRQAYDLQTQGFGPGANGPVVVAADLPSPSDKATMDKLANQIRADQDVAFVSPVRMNQAGDAALITVIPKSSPQDKATSDLVNRLRDNTVPSAVGSSGVDVKIGGVTAALEDQSTYMTDRMPLFIAGVVGLSFLLLLVAFHSPLISLKAAVMNLLSVSAAYGVMTLAANGGGLSNLIGIDHEVPVAPFMPVMMFAILFGLSMDYEVFLISRIREEYLKDGNTSRAVADGLAKTARVITAAAAIMVVVFLSFVTSQEVFLKLFGIGLASAVFLDATVVRMVLVPAVMQLLGKWNWWIPTWLERSLPRLDVERVAPAGAEGSS
jgi:RND superfamily putative drug exporter